MEKLRFFIMLVIFEFLIAIHGRRQKFGIRLVADAVFL